VIQLCLYFELYRKYFDQKSLSRTVQKSITFPSIEILRPAVYIQKTKVYLTNGFLEFRIEKVIFYFEKLKEQKLNEHSLWK
jgi:hypothetical protein